MNEGAWTRQILELLNNLLEQIPSGWHNQSKESPFVNSVLKKIPFSDPIGIYTYSTQRIHGIGIFPYIYNQNQL